MCIKNALCCIVGDGGCAVYHSVQEKKCFGVQRCDIRLCDCFFIIECVCKGEAAQSEQWQELHAPPKRLCCYLVSASVG